MLSRGGGRFHALFTPEMGQNDIRILHDSFIIPGIFVRSEFMLLRIRSMGEQFPESLKVRSL